MDHSPIPTVRDHRRKPPIRIRPRTTRFRALHTPGKALRILLTGRRMRSIAQHRTPTMDIPVASSTSTRTVSPEPISAVSHRGFPILNLPSRL
ncbi:hypothetical protein GCM10009813_21390 [Brevibacterium marinum]